VKCMFDKLTTQCRSEIKKLKKGFSLSDWNVRGSEMLNICKVCMLFEQSDDYKWTEAGLQRGSSSKALLVKADHTRDSSSKALLDKTVFNRSRSGKVLLEKRFSADELHMQKIISEGLPGLAGKTFDSLQLSGFLKNRYLKQMRRPNKNHWRSTAFFLLISLAL
jgi:hypothetical protein